MNHIITILEPQDFNAEAYKIMKTLGSVKIYDTENNNLETTILFTRLAFHLNRKFLSRFPNIQIIVSPTTGLNHIDLSYCEQEGIRVLSLKGEVDFLKQITATAEFAFTLILNLVRKIPASINSVLKQKKWDRNQFKGRELRNMTLGILGFGRLGQQVAEYAKVFGLKVLASDQFIEPIVFQGKKVFSCDKETLFQQSDIISIHVNYEVKNHNLVNCKEFQSMKDGSYFVNTARGELINEVALLDALSSGKLAGAALDVLVNEQDSTILFNSPLLQYAQEHENLLITPHIGGCTLESMQKTELFIVNKLKSFLENS